MTCIDINKMSKFMANVKNRMNRFKVQLISTVDLVSMSKHAFSGDMNSCITCLIGSHCMIIFVVEVLYIWLWIETDHLSETT